MNVRSNTHTDNMSQGCRLFPSNSNWQSPASDTDLFTAKVALSPEHERNDAVFPSFCTNGKVSFTHRHIHSSLYVVPRIGIKRVKIAPNLMIHFWCSWLSSVVMWAQFRVVRSANNYLFSSFCFPSQPQEHAAACVCVCAFSEYQKPPSLWAFAGRGAYF